MSFKTWIKEFYPVPVEELPKDISDIQAINHSLKKWKGALPKNTKKHNVIYSDYEIMEGTSTKTLQFFGETCALCKKYYHDKQIITNFVEHCFDPVDNTRCCPIVDMLNRTQTCNMTFFTSKNDVKEMVTLLKRTLKFVQNKENMS